MQFRINPLLLKPWNSSKQRSAQVIRNKFTVTAERFYRSINASNYLNALRCHLKYLRRQNLFMKLSMQLMTKNVTKKEREEDWGGPEAFKLITFIKDDFHDVLKNNSSVLVFFSAQWCPHCLRLRKPYGMAALMSKEANLPMTFATFDVNYNPDLADEKGVVGIPLIKYYKNGKFVTNYKGKRTAADLFDFAKNPPEPVKATEQPDI